MSNKKTVGKRTFVGVMFVPMLYIVTSFFLELVLFSSMSVPFPPYYYLSLLLVTAFALLISCIPSRLVQYLVAIGAIAMQTITTVANLIAYFQLGEIFIFETLRSLLVTFGAAGSLKFSDPIPFIIIGFIDAIALAIGIYGVVKLRRTRAGYPLRPFVAILSVVVAICTGIFVQISLMEKKNLTYFERLIDTRFSLVNFTNRINALHSFGSPMFYLNDFMSIAGLKSMADSPVAASIDMSTDGENYYDEYKDVNGDSLMLGTDTNVIMFMMETMELNAIDEFLTPNLWKIRNNSTWVDGYYATERTCFSEYASLTGMLTMGAEMWRDYPDVSITNSLPNIFRRAWTEENKTFQIGGFHTYDTEFYNRDRMFVPEKYGFDFIKNPKSYGKRVNLEFSENSDEEFIAYALEDVVPDPSKVDRFFSWFLGVSTHAPHFKETHTMYNERTGKYTSMFDQSLQDVMYSDDTEYFKTRYPKLDSAHLSMRSAVVNYLVGIREYDRAVGLILDDLEAKNLMDKTALILYGDHYNVMSYNNPRNILKGSLLSQNNFESPIGEKVAFMIYNPKDALAIASPTGRGIETFMTNNDIYKTVCHLFNIETHTNFTLGASVLARIGKDNIFEYPTIDGSPSFSIGVGFYNGTFFFVDPDDADVHFLTRDFDVFQTNRHWIATPYPTTLAHYRRRVETYAKTILKTRSYFDGNKFKNDVRTYYKIKSVV